MYDKMQSYRLVAYINRLGRGGDMDEMNTILHDHFKTQHTNTTSASGEIASGHSAGRATKKQRKNQRIPGADQPVDVHVGISRTASKSRTSYE